MAVGGGWWQGQSVAGQQPPAQDENQSKQIVDPSGKPVSSDFKPPQSQEELDNMIRNGIIRVNSQFNEFQGKYNQELNNYTEKFMATDLAPYAPIAFDHFKQLQTLRPDKPLAELYNMTVEFVQSQKKLGIKPPTQPAQRPNGNPIHIPGGGVDVGGGRFRNDEGSMANGIGHYSDAQRRQDSTDYTNARIREHEYKKTRGESGMPMNDYYKQIGEERRAQEITIS